MSDGVIIGEDFVSVAEAKADIVKFIRETVGPLPKDWPGKKKPDLYFAISVIKTTIPADVLKGEKRRQYERALDILFQMGDKLKLLETKLNRLWQVEDEVEDE